MSPLSTDLSPPEKLFAENRTPDDPLFTEHRNAPAMVCPFDVIENDAGLPELLITEGSAVVAVPNVAATRLPE